MAFDPGVRSVPGRWQPKRPVRLFLGVLVDSDKGDCIYQFGQKFCGERHLRGTPRRRELLHISLHFIGDYTHLPPRIIYGVKQASQTILLAPFDVTLNHVQSFDVPSRDGESKRFVLVLRAQGAPLVDLHRTLGAVLRKWGFKTGDHFTPHVTLLYGPDAIPTQAIEPIRFTVKDFALIHSERGLSRYNILCRWSLQG